MADNFRTVGFLRSLLSGWTWRMAWRESRSERGRLLLFAGSVAVGIAALVSVQSLKDSVQRGVDLQARSLLGADLQITARRPFTEDEVKQLSAGVARVGQETAFASMMEFGDAGARLVQVRGFEGEYPFYGEVETLPGIAWEEMKHGAGVLLEPVLMEQFSLKPGDTVKLGGVEFRVLGSIVKGAPRSGRFSGFAPEIYIRLDQLEQTGLLGPRSLAHYHMQLEIPGPAAIAEAHKTALSDAPSDWRMTTPQDRQENIGEALDRFQQFLGILALAALVLGATGVGGAVHAHVEKKLPSIAILRCLGCSAGSAFGVYFIQVLQLGLVAALAGTAAGVALHAAVVLIFAESLPVSVAVIPDVRAVLAAAGGGALVCWAFALPALMRVRHSSPRPGTESASLPLIWRVLLPLVLFASVLLLASQNTVDWKRALGLTAGLGAAIGILALLAKGVVAATRRFTPSTWPYELRQSLANLHRPQNQTLLFLTSLGMGIFLLATIYSARNLTLNRLDLTNMEDSPGIYLVDVQFDQADEVAALLARLDLPVLQRSPMVTMRLTSVKGVPVETLMEQGELKRWVLRREYRSTYRTDLAHTETLVAGEWFAGSHEGMENVPVSLEKDIAQDLDVSIGDVLELDVQGVEMSALVTSIREVDWSSFGLNFFMVFPPGVLESAPGFEVLTTRTESQDASGQLQRTLVREFPNVSAIDLTQLLETVRGILEQIARITNVLAGFGVVSGLMILIGVYLNGRDRRLRETVLLRTLGASGAQVRRIMVAEYAVLGLLSAVVGLILAVIANALLAHFVFKTAVTPDWTMLWVTPLVAMLVSVIAGVLFSHRSGTRAPLEILRAAE